jgi:hypothetical protein
MMILPYYFGPPLLIDPVFANSANKLSSTPQKSRSRFITVFSTCKDAFLKFESHIFYIG